MKEWIKRERTWSRQISFALLAFLCVLAWKGDRDEELKILTIPFTFFAVPAFGLKQPAINEWLRK